jgi:acyl carrier protein
MKKEAIEGKVKEILSERLLADPQELTPQTLLAEDLGMDSLDRIEIAIDLEEAFSVEQIDQAEADNWKSFADVLATAKKMARKNYRPAEELDEDEEESASENASVSVSVSASASEAH